MIVEIRGTKTANKGAELMLRAIVAELGRDPGVRLAVEPRIGTYEERAHMGLWQKFTSPSGDDRVAALGSRLPGRIRRHVSQNYGVVFESDIQAVLDAWGFAYSDQFDVERCEGSATRSERWKRQGKNVIVMPQAFGPFTSPRLRTAFAKLLDNTDLVFARDDISFEHVMAGEGRKDHIRRAPDFTCLLKGDVPEQYVGADGLALIVPSAKLLTETSTEIKSSYLPFLARTASALLQRGMDVRLMAHETGDTATVSQLNDLMSERVPVIEPTNALVMKGILSKADIVVSSRFHALVSALSQGVPSIAIGWSHKYQMLMDDYGCGDCILDPSVDSGKVETLMSTLLGSERNNITEQLVKSADKQRELTREMWSAVRSTLGISRSPEGR